MQKKISYIKALTLFAYITYIVYIKLKINIERKKEYSLTKYLYREILKIT